MQHYYLLLPLMNFKQLAQYFIKDTALLYEEEESMQMYEMVAEHLTGWNRAQLLMNGAEELSASQYDRYSAIVDELKKGRPVQHIFAEAWFYGLKFTVNSNVLIPRPETEELVDWILKSIPKSPARAIRLLDIGTGSGCIAISLKKLCHDVEVSAIDVSPEALAVARQNALANEVNINFIQADILDYEAIVDLAVVKYDLIVSNPPYITDDERAAMHQNVLLYEPHLALFVTNENPLIFYKSIADFALAHLYEKGKLYFEINEYLGKETVDMLKDKGFIDIVLKQDMQGKDRMICCSL